VVADPFDTTPDRNGRYQFTGEFAGRAVLRVRERATEVALADYPLELTFGGSHEATIHLSPKVIARGRVLLGGEPVRTGPGGEVPPAFINMETRAREEASFSPGGDYRIALAPGTYRLMIHSGPFTTLVGEPLVIREGEREVERDWLVPSGEAEVIIDTPEGREFQPGRLLAHGRTPWSEDGLSMRGTVQSTPSAVYPRVPAGDHRVVFSLGDALPGESDWTTVAEGTRTPIVVLFEKPEVRVFEATMTLEPGEYEYKFFAPPSTWSLDPLNLVTVPSGTQRNNFFRVPGGAAGENGVRQEWPRVNDTTGEVTFRWVLETTAREAEVLGTFNNWSPTPQGRMRPLE
jgi:hypothetical protein